MDQYLYRRPMSRPKFGRSSSATEPAAPATFAWVHPQVVRREQMAIAANIGYGHGLGDPVLGRSKRHEFWLLQSTPPGLAPNLPMSRAACDTLDLPASLTSATETFEPGRLERVEALHDPIIKGAVPTWYTQGLQTARELQSFMTGERDFIRTQIDVRVPLSLAVLDTKQWKLVERQLPYPMPSVSGEPPVALMPSDWTSGPDFFPKQKDSNPALVKAVLGRGSSWNDASHRAMDLVGGHELGHTAVDSYGIVPGTHWLNELLASYVMYAYLRHERRDLLWLIPVMQAICRVDRSQLHVSLEDFESRYMQILTTDAANYSWYQGQFMEQVQRVYARQGIAFLRKVHAAFPSGAKRFALGNAQTLHRLDAIDPSFSAWAKSLAALPRASESAPHRGNQ